MKVLKLLNLELYPQFRQLLGGQTSKKIFFLHIPKCGGSSLAKAVQNTYGFSENIVKRKRNLISLDPVRSRKISEITGVLRKDFEEKFLMYNMLNEHIKYIGGHFNYSYRAMENFKEEWHFITILRDPVSRWISNYFFNKYSNVIRNNSHYVINCDIDSFLNSEQALSFGTTYIQRLTGIVSPNEAKTDQAINHAIENLKKFSLVGTLERLDVFAEDYNKLFQAKLFIPFNNSNPLSKLKQKTEITDDIYKEIEKICEPDYQVWRALFNEDYFTH